MRDAASEPRPSDGVPAERRWRDLVDTVLATVDAAARAAGPWLDLYIRVWLAQAFLVSGLLKAANWENALNLARYEYPVNWMDPVTAAYVGAAIELIAPILLLLGLFTRAAAFPMMLLALVIQVNYRALDIHLLWVALLGWYVVRGAGALSLDRMLARGLADSALPLAAPAVRTAAWVSWALEPAYRLLLRLWLAVSFLIAGGWLTVGITNEILVYKSVAVFGAWTSLSAAALMLVGLALRPLIAVMIIALLSMKVMSPAITDSAHGLVLLLGALLIAGAGEYSLDALLVQRLRRLFPSTARTDLFVRDDIPRVVIVGAGFGGLACARGLRHTPVTVTLIDRHNYHLFQPLLYQVATTALAPGDIATPIRALLREQQNARVLLGEVTNVDTTHREVLLGKQRLCYDYLVLATGAAHSYFGHDEWAPHAPGLKRIEDATEVRSRLLLAFERAERSEDPAERAALLTFLVVGAGPTGVELSGAIAELARFGMEKEFRYVDPANARVILVQAGPRILPTFPEHLSERAHASLRKLGVEILTDSRVEHIDAAGVRVSGKPIVARTVFWAAGVVASPAAQWLNAPADRSGRVQVNDDLSVPGVANVFVIGDTAASNAWDGRLVPGIGPAAKQGGQYVARHIRAQLKGKSIPAFRYRHLGSLATIGRKSAVADFGFVRLSGTVAWWLWGLVHVYFLAGMRNRISVTLDWAWAYFTFRSSTRLITEVSASATAKEPTPAAALRLHHGR
jgi:NADH dehydrogenase/putative oxidoreductase